MRDPATAGTTIEASAAMRAARATTLSHVWTHLLEIGLQRADGGARSRVAASSQRGERGGRRRFGCAPAHAAARRSGRSQGGAGSAGRGSGDPTMRVASGAAIRASITPAGPGSIELRVAGSDPGACLGSRAALLLDGLPALLGLDDDDTGFEPGLHPTVAELARRRGRPRLGRTGAVWEALLPAILEQRITGTEAWRNYRRLVRWHEPGAGAAGAAGRAGAGGRARDPAMAPRGARDRASPRWCSAGRPARGRGSRPSARPPGCPPAAGRSGDLAAALRTIPGIGPDRGRGDASGARGPGRGERRRCPPLEPRDLRADRAGRGHRRGDARACSRRGRAIGRGSSGCSRARGSRRHGTGRGSRRATWLAT